MSSLLSNTFSFKKKFFWKILWFAIACSLLGYFLYEVIQTIKCKKYFDAGYYQEAYPGACTKEMDPFMYYMLKGYKSYKNPSARFDARFYEKIYMATHRGDLNTTVRNPLRHYVEEGIARKAITHPLLVKKAIPLKKPTYRLAMAALFRDEARFLKEWIEYHLMLGVEHFYLTNHLSKDNYMEVLQPYIDRGLVTLAHETRECTHIFRSYKTIQDETYQKALKRAEKEKVEWLLILDIDEFLVPPKNCKDLQTLMQCYEPYAAVAFHWKTFGTSNVEKVGSDELLTEKLTRCASDDSGVRVQSRKLLAAAYMQNQGIKCAMRPRYVTTMKSAHFPLLKPGFLIVNSEKTYIKPFHYVYPIGKGPRVHHYYMRDKDFLNNVKIPRALKFTKGHNWGRFLKNLSKQEEMLNAKEDRAIFSFLPQLRRRMRLGEVEKKSLHVQHNENKVF